MPRRRSARPKFARDDELHVFGILGVVVDSDGALRTVCIASPGCSSDEILYGETRRPRQGARP